jgi:hypothetical protein
VCVLWLSVCLVDWLVGWLVFGDKALLYWSQIPHRAALAT